MAKRRFAERLAAWVFRRAARFLSPDSLTVLVVQAISGRAAAELEVTHIEIRWGEIWAEAAPR